MFLLLVLRPTVNTVPVASPVAVPSPTVPTHADQNAIATEPNATAATTPNTITTEPTAIPLLPLLMLPVLLVSESTHVNASFSSTSVSSQH